MPIVQFQFVLNMSFDSICLTSAAELKSPDNSLAVNVKWFYSCICFFIQ